MADQLQFYGGLHYQWSRLQLAAHSAAIYTCVVVVSAMDVMWLTNYSFMVAYISSGADCSEQPSLLLINGQVSLPKYRSIQQTTESTVIPFLLQNLVQA